MGEQVWVNGVKLGVIAYLGETQFAPGQWAGVILNDLVGKNDGSVGGVRYFECQPLQGIFTRPSKLNRQPVGEGSDSHSADSFSAQNHTQQGGNGVPPGQRVVVPLREGLLNSAVKTGYESGSNMSDSGSVKGSVKKGGEKDLRVGDRVLVSTCVLEDKWFVLLYFILFKCIFIIFTKCLQNTNIIIYFYLLYE